jgi:hypothetical protein
MYTPHSTIFDKCLSKSLPHLTAARGFNLAVRHGHGGVQY